MLCIESWQVELHWWQTFEKTKVYPSYEQYLANGQESVVLPTIMAGLLAMVAQPLDTFKLHSLALDNIESLLDKLLLTYGASLRLANDICGFERE